MQKKILIVDDNESNLRQICALLENEGYFIAIETNPMQVRASIILNKPDLILLDINMRGLNGIDLCERIVKDPQAENAPVILISTMIDENIVSKCFNAGAVDIITVPFRDYEVKARVATHIKMYHLQYELEEKNNQLENIVETQNKTITEMQMATIFSLAKLAQSRDDDTGKHLERVQKYCYALSKQLAEKPKFKNVVTDEFIKNIVYASPLHDIGKVGIPDSVLLKPGKFTPEEFEEMKKHTTLGAETLEEVYGKFPKNEFVKMGIDIAKYHHERWDGTGYPEGLKGEEIPLSARIMAIADVYDALSSKRLYKEAYNHKKCMEIMIEGRGTQFDPDLIDALVEIKEDFALINQLYNNGRIVK